MAKLECLSTQPGVARPTPVKRIPRPLLQLSLACLLLLVAVWFIYNLVKNVALLGGTFGFSFLDRAAGFDIGESLISYSSSSSYLQAIAVGILNTINLAFVGALGALLGGFVLAMLRASNIKALRNIVDALVDVIRNTPLLLQLFIWSTVVKDLPGVRQALEPMHGVFLSNRGLQFPLPADNLTWGVLGVALLLVVTASGVFIRSRKAGVTSRAWLWWLGAALILVIYSLTRQYEMPQLHGFNIRGGGGFSPEFLCMAAGIMVYHAVLVAEIIRAGFDSVPKGQFEAGKSLGIPRPIIFLKIILPQALRLIVLPTTALFQGLVRNTSLAVAVGFPEFLSVINTVTGQTGQPIETALILIIGYFTLSFVIAKLGNALNLLVQLKER